MTRAHAAGGTPGGAPRRSSRAAWLACCVLVLACAGCIMPAGFQDSASLQPDSKVAIGDAGKTSDDAKDCSCHTKPHTLPEAICDYIHCLQTPPELRDTAKKDKDAADKNGNGKKNPDEPSKDDSNAKKDNGDKGGKKNPDTAPQADAKEPQTGDQDAKKNPDETDKAKDNGTKDQGDTAKDKDKEPDISWYSAHAQFTGVTQDHDIFRAPYTGTNSLKPNEPMATSITATLFLDARLWEGGELVFNPEIAGGSGFSGTTGIASFPNGEITRVGTIEPTPYIARLFFRQTFGFGGGQEDIEDAANELSGKKDMNRFVISIGKFSATDFADDNTYSHDPRGQFLPWGLMYNGAWDYPANVRGYTYGVSAEYHTQWWTLTYGIFAEPAVANGAELDPHIADANGQVLEWEQRYELNKHKGAIRLLGYLNHAHMGNYSEALAQMPVDPNITLTRAYRFKYGLGLNWEQELTEELGIFGRLGWDNGQSESWAFTEIDRLAEIGLSLKGTCWCRPKDVVGLAYEIDGLSGPHRNYLGAGGLGFIIGDGQLNYSPEQIFDAYYSYQVIKGIFFTLDFQEVLHPAYNRARGPVSIGSARLHLEF
jgi:high affinity Mn2+ porin